MTFIKAIASIGAAMLIGLSALSAQAGYVVNLTQTQGGEVVATGSGAIDLTGLTLVHGFVEPRLNPPDGFISIGKACLRNLTFTFPTPQLERS